MPYAFTNGATTLTPFGKVNYTYTTDDVGVPLLTIKHREAAMDAVAGNTALKANAGKPPRPSRWKLRHVHAFVLDGNKLISRSIVVCDPASIDFNATDSDVPLDGLTFKIHGRSGEKRSS